MQKKKKKKKRREELMYQGEREEKGANEEVKVNDNFPL